MVMEEALDQMPAAGCVVMAIEYLKSSSFPWFKWFTRHSDTLNRSAAVVMGLVAATGIHYSVQGTWSWLNPADIHLHLPAAKDMLEGAEHVALQMLSQEGMYRGYRLVSLLSSFLKRPELDEVLKSLSQILKSPLLIETMKQSAGISTAPKP